MKMASLSPGHSVIPSFLFGRRFRVLLSVAVGVSIIGFLAKFINSFFFIKLYYIRD